MDNLVFYVPLLTMGLFSREYLSGSIKLLQSAPVHALDIVLGKYLAAVALIGAFAAFLAGLVVLSMAFVPDLDASVGLAGILGFALLAAAYAAIGLFMSSLTSHQLVAALSTVATLALLNFVGSVGQRIPYLDDIAFWLSMQGRAETMRDGLVGSSDIAYFVLIAILFIGLTYLRLVFARDASSLADRGSRIAALLAAVLLGGIGSSQPAASLYWDATFDDRESLSPESREIMRALDGAWQITVYVNVLDDRVRVYLPSNHNQLASDLLRDYRRENPRLRVAFEYFYGPSSSGSLYDRYPDMSEREIAREFARQNGFNFDRFHSIEDIRHVIGWRARTPRPAYFVLQWNGNHEVIGTFEDNFIQPAEKTLSAGIRRLTEGAVQVGFLSANGERSFRDRGEVGYQIFLGDERQRYTMVNHGFDFDQIDSDRKFDDAYQVLVVADPTGPYSPDMNDRLKAYIEGGGNLLLLVEPSRLENVRALLSLVGLEEDKVIDPSFRRELAESAFAGEFVEPFSESNGQLSILKDRLPLTLNGAVALAPTEDTSFSFRPVAGVNKYGSTARVAWAGQRQIAGKTQRIVVFGDADVFAGRVQGLGYPVRGNVVAAGDAFRFLSEERYPIELTPAEGTSSPDDYVRLELRDLAALRIWLYGLIPGILVLAGIALLSVRRWA